MMPICNAAFTSAARLQAFGLSPASSAGVGAGFKPAGCLTSPAAGWGNRCGAAAGRFETRLYSAMEARADFKPAPTAPSGASLPTTQTGQ
jgi:hypothetical protein